MTAFDVFLSHNSKDKPSVRRLAESLKTRGLKVWLDEWELVPGRPWQQALEEIIKTANSAAVLIGKEGMGPWEEPEMRAALDQFVKRKSPVIPVLLPDAPKEPELPLFLTGFTWVDLRGGEITDEGLDRLVWGITGRKPRRRKVSPPDSEPDRDPSDEVQRFAELTTYACHRIAEIASHWLAQECDPFVMPALARRAARSEAMMSPREADPWEPILDDDCRALVLGQLPQDRNRVRVFSQSGTGKTTLLHFCEQQIAGADDGRLPIRVSALSSYDWRGDVPVTFVGRVLHPFLPTDSSEAERCAWLRQLIRDHRVVFLFDAVDQTDDQLAGLSQFLQSFDVCHCPTILTGRPEVEQTRAGVFREANWETYRVEPFDEQRVRQYLGDLSDKLLPVEDEEWQDRPSWERKQQWSDLLHVPLLLRLMRRVAADESEEPTQVTLTDLHNRHAIYREAVRHLVDQGWTSLSQTPNREDLLDHAEINAYLSEMAWGMIAEDNFTSVFQGESFRRWRAQNRHAVRALEQVDLTTRYSLLDNPGEFGLAWRHLSFCEYFAGTHLARLDRAEQESVVQNYGRKPSWQWVFRFALSELEAEGKSEACADLARDLMRFGNPFLVFDAVDGDGLRLPEQLDTLCRWLVHRDWSPEKDYTQAWQTDQPPPEVDDQLLDVLDPLFERAYRESRCLHPAWELLTSSSHARAAAICERFLSEFSEILAGSQDASHARAPSLTIEEHFVRCPPVDREHETFHLGEKAERPVQVGPFFLGLAPVTNAQFELFDPSHRSSRDQYSPDDDGPATYVSWYMAVMFCTWLGAGHRLPTEDEWEVACRAGTTTTYWWGDDFDGTKCNSAESKLRLATPANPDHANAWGLMEMSGNAWEWCDSYWSEGSKGRVLRGGSFNNNAHNVRSAYRFINDPGLRSYTFGFRLARTYP